MTQQNECRSRTLSVFVDSSKRVYACAAYITTETQEGRRYTHLYCGKSKVAPIGTTQTIPKLELLAIFIGINMMEYILSKSGLIFDKLNLFSDSTIALSWVHSKKRLPSLVATLTQKIQLSRERIACYRRVNFYHVPTCENVADHATRGLSREEARNHVWFKGPAWLNLEHSKWPVRATDELTEDDEERCLTVFTATQKTEHLQSTIPRIWPTEKVSSYSKLKRITAYCLQFIRNASNSKAAKLEHQGESFGLVPNVREMMLAERYLLREEQQQSDLQLLIKIAKTKVSNLTKIVSYASLDDYRIPI